MGLSQVGSCGIKAKLQLTVAIGKLKYLQVGQVNKVWKQVIKCINKAYISNDGWLAWKIELQFNDSHKKPEQEE